MNVGAGGRAADRVLGVLAVACVALQFPGTLALSAVSLAAWLAALAWLDRPALRRMWMPRFFAITVVLALATGVVLGRKDFQAWGVPLSSDGFAAGALMVVRGALIFGLSTWAGPAVAGRRLPGLLRHVGLERLGASAAVALGLLPELQARLGAAPRIQASAGTGGNPGGRAGRIGRLHARAVSAFCETVRLAEDLARAVARPARVRVAALQGAPGEGKTTRILAITARLREAGLEVGGVVQPAVHMDGKRTGYDLLDVATGDRVPFARVAPATRPGGPRFAFDKAGWDWASERIRRARRDADVVVVDEVGRLEASGGGHLEALRVAMPGGRERWWLLSVRRDGAAAVQQWVGGFDLREDVGGVRGGAGPAGDDLAAGILERGAAEDEEGAG